MAYNLGSVNTAYDLGYTGTYTGGGVTYPYQLTSHGAADPNSIMADANFATTDPVDIRIISDFDSAKVVFDWQAFSDNQLWRDDISTLSAVTVNASTDTTDSATIGWKKSDGTTGQFTATVSIDGTGATITSVSVPADGTYTPGQTLSFTGNWSESVNIGGTPAINFTIGGSPRQANYASGDGTAATLFSYTVQSGDEGAVSVGTLTLDGGTIKDAAGNDADLTLNSVGDPSGVLVDGVGPFISINGLTTLDTTPIASGSAGDATSLSLDVEGLDVTHSSTYSPTISNGSWAQQLSELAIGTYTMTLTGTDDAGNETVVTATLNVVDEIITSPRGLFQPLFRSLTGSVNQTLFR